VAGHRAPRPWLATAYVPAPSLAVTVTRQGALPPSTVLLLIVGVAKALQSIHAAGVIHRDLKPGNVILAADGPRVIDFGIARAVEAASVALTQGGARIGTPAFMSPEQVQGRSLGPAGDVFALGATAYYAVTGALPFGADAAVFHRIVHEHPVWDRCPAQVRGVLERCVEKDPAARPAPAALIELCRAASTDERLHISKGWLPPAMAADLTRYSLTPPEPAAPLPATEAGRARSPQSPTPASPPARPGRRRSPWLIGGFSTAALAATLAVVPLVVPSNTPSRHTRDSATPSAAAPASTSAGTGTISNPPTADGQTPQPTGVLGTADPPERVGPTATAAPENTSAVPGIPATIPRTAPPPPVNTSTSEPAAGPTAAGPSTASAADTSSFHLAYGASVLDGTITWYNRSLRISGSVKAVSGSKQARFHIHNGNFTCNIRETRTAADGTTKGFGFDETCNQRGGFSEVDVFLLDSNGNPLRDTVILRP
jgi:serine/threonine protein kinase